MEDPVDGAELRASQEVVRATPRWLAGVAIFLLGVGVGALAFGLDTSDPDAAVEDSIAVGCGAQVTLIVDARTYRQASTNCERLSATGCCT